MCRRVRKILVSESERVVSYTNWYLYRSRDGSPVYYGRLWKIDSCDYFYANFLSWNLFIAMDTIHADNTATGTLLSGREKRSAFKNRWLDTRKSTMTSAVVSVERDRSESPLMVSEEQTGNTRRSSTNGVKNRWLKGLLTTSVIRRPSGAKNTEEGSNSTSAVETSHDVCLMSDSPFYHLTVSAKNWWRRILNACFV